MVVLNIIFLTMALYVSSRLYALYKNYTIARSVGLPITISPVDPYGFFWNVFHSILRPFLQSIPFKNGMWWARAMDPGWSWVSDFENHRELGMNYIMVNPDSILLYTCEGEVLNEVLTRRKEFVKPALYENMEFFGKNVDTVNGDDWSRHRRITAPCFNERVSSLVWDESLRQAHSMLSQWLSQPNGKIANMVDDTRVIALHVLTSAGFGISHDYHGGARLPAAGHKLSHRDSLMTLLNHLTTTIVLGQMPWLESIRSLLPKHLQHVKQAINEFDQYMDEMLATERRLMAQQQQNSAKPNLISTLIRTSDEANSEGQTGLRLTDQEIKGNLFIFNLAGHDTTANTLAYAVALLAAYPEIQDWVVEEVDAVLGEDEDVKYETVFPKLKRVLAVMYETLRLYGPVPTQPREALHANTPLTITDQSSSSPSSPPSKSRPTKTILIPAGVGLSLNIHASHTNPSTFPNPSTWDPKRWIKSPSPPASSPSSPATATGTATETDDFLPPPVGYFPWSSGPRICPGMKFAQVEFVAVMSTVLRGARLLPGVKGDVDVGFEDARREVLSVVRDSELVGPTLSMKRPEDLVVRVLGR